MWNSISPLTFSYLILCKIFLLLFILDVSPTLRLEKHQNIALARNPDTNRNKFLFETVNEDILEDDIYELNLDDEEEDYDEREVLQPSLVKEYNPSLHKSLPDEVYDQHDYILNGIEGVRIKPSFLSDSSPPLQRYEYTHRVILWYNPFCARCQRFKSTYLKLAQEVTNIVNNSTKNDAIEFHALSCSAHHWLCEEYEIFDFPSIWIYRKKSNMYQILKDYTVDSLTSMLYLNFHIGTDDIGENKSIPSQKVNYPEMQENISAAATAATTDKVDVKESENDVIDILGASKDIHKRTRNDIFHDAAMSFMHSIISIESITSTASSSTESKLKYTLNTLLFHRSKNVIDQNKEEALFEYLDLLFWSLPPSWKLLTIVSELRFALQEYQSSSTTINEKELTMLMSNSIDSHQDFVLENRQPIWTQSCSSRNKGGKTSTYQCGLWNLFHIISIGVAERHKAVLGGRGRVSTEHAALTLQHFVSNFISSDEEISEKNRNELNEANLSEHEYWKSLLQLYIRDCGFKSDVCNRFRRQKGKQSHLYYSDVEHWRDFPLWLWEIHNEMNILNYKTDMKENGKECCTREQEFAVLRPSLKECPKCHDEDGGWNRKEVYEYLKKQYWPSGIHNFRYVVLDVKDHKVENVSNQHQWLESMLLLILVSCFMYLLWNKILTKNNRMQKKHND